MLCEIASMIQLTCEGTLSAASHSKQAMPEFSRVCQAQFGFQDAGSKAAAAHPVQELSMWELTAEKLAMRLFFGLLAKHDLAEGQRADGYPYRGRP